MGKKKGGGPDSIIKAYVEFQSVWRSVLGISFAI